jgi:GNAT superfamily N-acetyltransferase
MDAQIRFATAHDVPVILDCIRQLAVFEHLEHEVSATAEQLTATLFPPTGQATAECVLAFVGESPAGFALFFHNYSTFLAQRGLYLEDLFVRPDFRGRGVGKALMLFLARTANERGCGRMEWSVLDWNQRAIGFYESLGAAVMPDWRICRLTGAALRRHA